MKYSIVEADTLDELVERVSEVMKSGYRPLGGVNATVVSWRNERDGCMESEWTYLQAMTEGAP